MKFNWKYTKLIVRNIKKYAKYYSEGDWKQKLHVTKDLIGEHVLMPMIRLYFVMKSPGTPIIKKVYIAGALGYFILPFDIIPDFLAPVIGFSDDLAVATLILRLVDKYVTPEIELKSRKFYESICPVRRSVLKFR